MPPIKPPSVNIALKLSTLQRLFGLSLLLAMAVPLNAQEWTIGNTRVAKTIVFDNQSGLSTKSWRDLNTSTEFIHGKDGWREFQVTADGQAITGSSADVRLERRPGVVTRGANAYLEVALAARKLPLRIIVHYETYPDFAAVRQWLTLENTGSKPLVLRNLTVECQGATPGPARDLIAFGHYGEEPRETYFTGRVNDVAALLENARTGEGLAVLSEVPGYLKRTEIGGWEPAIQAMYDTDLFPFERRLDPGEKFETAAVSVVFYRRGTTTDPHWVLPQYAERVIAHNTNEQPPNWIYNDWEPWNGKATEPILQSVLPRALDMGLTLNTIDEGWEKTLGDNTIDTNKFPNGLKPLFEIGSDHTLKRGLWLPVSLVSEASSVYRQHPEWVCRGRDGKPKQSQGQGVVMCLASPYKQAALDRVGHAIQEYNLDYVKLDLTTVFNTYGEEPGCYETGHEHASSAESTVRIYEALTWLANKLHQQFPNLLIDYTFELWGEKHLIDYGLLRVADLDWLSNVSDRATTSAGPLQVRTLLYQRAMAIPTEDMLIGNMQGETSPWQERVATAMASAPVFLGDLRQLSEDDIRQSSKWITRFQQLRKQVALNDSFFPLGSWRQPEVTAWDGYGRFANSGEGIVVIFRNDSQDPSARIAIPGFPDGDFHVTDWSSGISTSLKGRKLSQGWSVQLTGKPRVIALEIRK